MEFDLTRLKQGLPGVGGKSLQTKGRIVIRCREATQYDVRFVEELVKGIDSAELQALRLSQKDILFWRHCTTSCHDGMVLRAIRLIPATRFACPAHDNAWDCEFEGWCLSNLRRRAWRKGWRAFGDSAKHLFVVVCVDLAGNREGLSIVIYLLARLHTSFSKHLCLYTALLELPYFFLPNSGLEYLIAQARAPMD